MERNPVAIGRRRFEGDAVSPPLFSPPLPSSLPPLPSSVGPASSWKPVFRSNGTSSQSGITIVNFMAGCSLAGFLFPFTDQSATRLECILIHPFFSYCRNPPPVSISLSPSLSFSSAIHHFVSEFIVLRRGGELPVRLNGRNYILENLLHFIES